MNLIVKDLMTRGAHTIEVECSLRDAARLMDDLNVGALPVMEAERIVGIATDRDMVVRGIVRESNPGGMSLRDVMSSPVRNCFEDQPVGEVLREMQRRQIRRMPVLDRSNRLIGMLALADVATKASGREAAALLASVSEPAEPDAPRHGHAIAVHFR